MSPNMGPTGQSTSSHLWMLLYPLLSALVLATGSAVATEDMESTTATSVLEEWTGTPIQLQPDLQTEAQTPTETQTETQTPLPATRNYTGRSCVPVLPPRRGSFYVESGTGVSVGSVLAFWCREGYQLVGSDKIYCNIRNGKAQWSNYLPVCEAIPRPEDRGLRVAVLASVVSGIVILAMSLSFLICCLQERSSRDRLISFSLPLRSQESLLKASLPGLYRSDSQLYPHVVLQRVPTPTAPSAPSAPSAPLYLHLPPASSAASSPAHTGPHSPPHMMAQYPTPTYPPNPNTAVPAYPHPTPAPIYPNPNPTPQRPWQ
uniref:Sushi domain-containing protein n=1 Tax=Anabas testudineus TaxID=64144 RepID=A0A7N6BBK9_ANATE